MINALIVSGISTKEFEFLGFLPLNKKLRRQKLKEIENSSKTIIIYEAPHKMKTTLGDLKEILKDRKIVLARELTKIHEEFIRKSINEYKSKGKGVLLVSAELEEVMSLADRIIVMYEGGIAGILSSEEATEENVGFLMTGGNKSNEHKK